MTARTYTKLGAGGTDEIIVKPFPGAGRVEVDVLRPDGLRAPIKRIAAEDPDLTADEIGAFLLGDGYVLTPETGA